ncbi:hypothetical protein ACLE20_06465 [Rhizobium sp. YIM 134829]|uniref:hypothetical protein n=1 Tax=Rhizobium sp. YIM 134829 TaxID=3390453 RepID=UPI00397E7A88
MSKTAVFSTLTTVNETGRRSMLTAATLPACARVVALVSAFGFVAACVFGAI